jgi:hypothetical protein
MLHGLDEAHRAITKAEEPGPLPGAVPSGSGEAGRKRPGPEGSVAWAAWNARHYFKTHSDRTRHATFRRHGLPLTSCHIESGISVRQDRPDRQADRTSGKQANRRVREGQVRRRGSYRTWKGSEKQLDLDHAEEILGLGCFALSQDRRWDEHFDALRRGEVEVPPPGRVGTTREPAGADPENSRAA